MEQRGSPALLGWLAVFTVVVFYDVWALVNGKETLSAYFARTGSKTKAGRVAIYGSWLGLSWHLMHGHVHLLPERHRPIYRRWHPLWALHDLASSRANVRFGATAVPPLTHS